MKKKEDIITVCCVDYAFQRIGGKHKARILWNVHLHGVLRYGQLKTMITGITTKMLTQTLHELEEDDLLYRKVYREFPPKVEYTLTASAQELIPPIVQLRQWGEERVKKEKHLVAMKL